MKYTTTKPTEYGYYWMRTKPFGPEIVYIGTSLVGRGLRVRHSDIFPGDPELATAHPSIEWAGPIPKPEESDAESR